MCKLIFGTEPRLQILYNKNRVAASSWKRTKAVTFVFLSIIIKIIWKYANTWHLGILRRDCLNIWRNKKPLAELDFKMISDTEELGHPDPAIK